MESNDIAFYLLYGNFDSLCKQAEYLQVLMPTNKNSEYKDNSNKCSKLLNFWTGRKLSTQMKVFKTEIMHKFKNSNKPQLFFTQSERSFLVNKNSINFN